MNEIAPITRPRAPTIQYEVSDIERMARAIAASKLFGMATEEQAIALCLIAQAEGRHPASAAQDYHIIQNKPSKKADAMLRDFLNAGGKVEWHKLDDTVADATFSHAAGGTVRIAWDHARAQKAGIANPMWKKYPRQMLRSRTVSEGVRTVFPLATSGMYVPEEVQEFAPSNDDREIEATAIPQRSSHRLKQEGGDDVFKSLVERVREAKSVPELQALHKQYAMTIASWKPDWQATFENEIYDPRLAELSAERRSKPRAKALEAPVARAPDDGDDVLSPADSATLLRSLIAVAGRCESRTALREWLRDAETKSAVHSLVVSDYETFEQAYESRRDQLPEEA